MRILLDECLPLDLRHSFSGHEAHTVQWAGLKGKKNGDLLSAAEAAGYSVLLTVDQGFPHQHAMEGRAIAIVILRSSTNQLEDLIPLTNAALEAMLKIRPGEVISIDVKR